MTDNTSNVTPSNDQPVVEKEGTKVTVDLKKLGKRALLWGGAAVGLIAGAVLLKNTNVIASAIEDDSVTIFRPNDDILIIQETPVTDETSTEVPTDQQ